MLSNRTFAVALLTLILAVTPAFAQDEEDAECLACHGDVAELTKLLAEAGSERDPATLFVNTKRYANSLARYTTRTTDSMGLRCAVSLAGAKSWLP